MALQPTVEVAAQDLPVLESQRHHLVGRDGVVICWAGVEVDFLDREDFIVIRDVIADKSFNGQGEYYGSQWIKPDQIKKVKKVEVHEVEQKNKVEAPKPGKKPEMKRVPVPPKKFDRKAYFEEKNPKLKEIFSRQILTEKDVQEALSMTRVGTSATDDKPEDKEKKPKETADEN